VFGVSRVFEASADIKGRSWLRPLAQSSEALLSLPEVRRILGVSRATLQRMIRRGDLPVIEVGPQGRRIAPDDLRAFIAARRRRRGGAI
jgi:excisionase family DNA binding protein